MPTICMFRGIKIFMNYRDHLPTHFHAEYGENNCCISAVYQLKILKSSVAACQISNSK